MASTPFNAVMVSIPLALFSYIGVKLITVCNFHLVLLSGVLFLVARRKFYLFTALDSTRKTYANLLQVTAFEAQNPSRLKVRRLISSIRVLN